MTQEKLMKNRMIRMGVLFLITLVALIIFIALYIDESNLPYTVQFISRQGIFGDRFLSEC